jgi:hypothetical protein
VKWFSIIPKEGQMQNTFAFDRRSGRINLNGRIIGK